MTISCSTRDYNALRRPGVYVFLCGIALISSCCRGLEFQLLQSDPAFQLQSNSSYTENGSTIPVAKWVDHNSSATSTSTALLQLMDFSNFYAIGRVVYKDAIKFENDSGSTNITPFSFRTYFSFQIQTAAPYGWSGDGLAFFVSSEKGLLPYSQGGALGLNTQTENSNQSIPWYQYDDRRLLFALEFDIFENIEISDPSACHIGIDIHGLNSSAVYNCNNASDELYLYNNKTVYTWLEYDSVSHLIQVWATTKGEQRPSDPILTHTQDLSSVLNPSMYVGLSSSDGLYNQSVFIYSWNFSIDNGESASSTAAGAAPAPLPVTVMQTVAPSNGRKSTSLVVIVLAVGAGLLLPLGLAVVVVIRIRRRRRQQQLPMLGALSRQAAFAATISNVPRYSYRDLWKATGGFSQEGKIGEGGFSVVYKGTLRDGSEIAVKKLKQKSVRMEAEFVSELQVICKIRHRNLMELQGWCYDNGEAMLVYKFMSRGSLENYIFHHKRRQGTITDHLSGAKRFDVLLRVAAALEYLHEGLGEKVLHRDVKAANVMLSDEWEAKLGDFGLARLITQDMNDGAAVTMTAAGTPGYVPPEVIDTGKANDKADVYGFGVLALEVACGRRVLDSMLMQKDMRLMNWVWQLHLSGDVLKSLDPLLQSEVENEENICADTMKQKWRCVLHVGLLCSLPPPQKRPSIRQAHQALRDIVIMELPRNWPKYDGAEFSNTKTTVGMDGDWTTSTTATSTSTASTSISQSAIDPSLPPPQNRPSIREAHQALREIVIMELPQNWPTYDGAASSNMNTTIGMDGDWSTSTTTMVSTSNVSTSLSATDVELDLFFPVKKRVQHKE